MGAPNIKEDAQRVFEVIKAGGLAVIPGTVGYTMVAASSKALEKMFQAKRRSARKRHAMGGNYDLHHEVHIMEPLHAEIVRSLVQDFDLPLGIIAKYRKDHPVVRNIDSATLEATTANDTLFMLINAGSLLDELTKLTMAAGIPILGSSANLTGTGNSSALSF